MNLSRLRHASGAALLAAIPFLVVACGKDTPPGPTTSTPKVSSISPTSGSTTGGNTVTITGTGFASDATVSIGGIPATGVVVSGTTSITAVTGVRTAAGPVEVTVTTGGKASTLSNAFTFVAPSGANRAPVISAFRSIGSRNNQPSGFADIDETVQVLATVTDSDTSNASLTYEWTAPGTLTPSGPTLTWKLPNSVSGGTPATVTLGLKVTEKFAEGGVTHTQSTSGSFAMRVHDSQKEILDAGEDFLRLFSDSTIPTDQVLHNFSTTCDGGRGRRDEASDTDNARLKYRQNLSRFRITRLPPATFNFGGACLAFGSRVRPADACSLFTVHWEFTYLVSEDGRKPGDSGVTDGTDHVTAVLQNDRWLLCHSDFTGTVTNTLTGEIRSITW